MSDAGRADGSATELPSIESIRDRARDGADGGGANLLARPLGEGALSEGVELGSAGESDAYVGDGAARAGLLAVAATVAADGDARLHHPEIDRTAPGPWLALEPLSGRLGTVVRGRAKATVALDRAADRGPAADDERLSAVLEAARPRHEHYPVADDSRGIFTTGMTAFSLADVEVESGTLSVVFDVATTPATTAAAVRDRFADCPGVRAVRLDRERTVRRTAPDDGLRQAAEAAHVSVRGDWEYAWLPPDSSVTAVPDPNVLALGTGTADRPFDADDFETCRRLLERTLAALEGSR